MPEVDLGTEEEGSEEADLHFLDTMRERLAILKDTPLPQQDTPLPGKQTPYPRDDPPLPDTPPQSEGMLTRAQKRAGGGKIRHVPITRAARQQVHLARPPPPARESTGQAQQQQALEESSEHTQKARKKKMGRQRKREFSTEGSAASTTPTGRNHYLNGSNPYGR
jgi:hypothetical protein